MLWTEFARIQNQNAAGIRLVCYESHEHTDACHRYGFHRLRRAIATAYAETLIPDALQALMRHKSYTATQRYVNITKQLNRAVENLAFPHFLNRRVR